MSIDMRELFDANEIDRYELHTRHLNQPLTRQLAMGYNTAFLRGSGAYLYDRNNVEYLDLLAGWGVFAIGRNHPSLREALKSTIDGEMPNLVQTDVSVLAGVLAQKLLAHTPYLERVLFTNSGAETVEAAIKLSRAATGRAGLISCTNAFHGLTTGALSLTGASHRAGFGPLLPDCVEVPFNDLGALEQALRPKQAAAFVVEPIQGASVNLPADDYLAGAAALCRKYGTLFVADEIKTGLGRTGRFLAIDHWAVEPDMVLLSKALSGGFVPVGALLTRQWVFDAVYKRTGRPASHGSTFSKNDLAMSAGIATLEVLETERLIERSATMGKILLDDLTELARKHDVIADVRGKGLMIAIEFHAPRQLQLRAAWRALEAVKKGAFCLLFTVPLLNEHKLLTQAAGHVIELTPPFVISETDCKKVSQSFKSVLSNCEQVPGAIWSLGSTIATNLRKVSAR